MKELVFAGSGGQGVLTCGLITAEIAAQNKWNTTWSPSYGSAMRGGDANCTVKYSQGEIYNPTFEEPNVLMAMNQSSFDKFIGVVAKNGLVVCNKDMVTVGQVRDDITLFQVPCNTMANKLGRPSLANVIMLGALVRLASDFSKDEAIAGMNQMFEKKGKGRFNESNTQAFIAGYEYREG